MCFVLKKSPKILKNPRKRDLNNRAHKQIHLTIERKWCVPQVFPKTSFFILKTDSRKILRNSRICPEKNNKKEVKEQKKSSGDQPTLIGLCAQVAVHTTRVLPNMRSGSSRSFLKDSGFFFLCFGWWEKANASRQGHWPPLSLNCVLLIFHSFWTNLNLENLSLHHTRQCIVSVAPRQNYAHHIFEQHHDQLDSPDFGLVSPVGFFCHMQQTVLPLVFLLGLFVMKTSFHEQHFLPHGKLLSLPPTCHLLRCVGGLSWQAFICLVSFGTLSVAWSSYHQSDFSCHAKTNKCEEVPNKKGNRKTFFDLQKFHKLVLKRSWTDKTKEGKGKHMW